MPPLRQATRRYPDLASFLAEHESTLSKGALLLPADQAGGELAPEIKLDLVLPLVGRVGPVAAQVVARMPDGGVALRLPDAPAALEAGVRKVLDAIDEVRRYLVATGELVPRAELDLLLEERAAALAAPSAEPEPPSASAVEVDPAVFIEDEEPAPEVDEAASSVETQEEPPPAPRPRGVPTLAVDGLQPSLTGPLGDGTLRRALIALALSRETGALRVRTADGQTRLGYWRAGGPVAWRSDPQIEEEALGRLLLKSGQVSAEQLEEAWGLMERTGCRQGEALIALGALQAPQLPLVLTRQAEFVLMRILQEKSGSWAFFPLDALPDAFEAPPVPVAGLLTRAFITHARKLPPAQLKAALKKAMDSTLTLRPEAVSALRDLRYSREEALVLDLVRVGPRPVAELLERGPAPFDVAAPLIWALLDLGIAELGKKESREARNQRAAAALGAKKSQVTSGTPFEVLELHWICLPEEIERSRQRLKAELSPAVLGELDPEMEALSREVVAAIDAAAALLLDPKRRRALRKRLIAPEDLERCVELLRAAAGEAEDEGKARVARAKAEELAAG